MHLGQIGGPVPGEDLVDLGWGPGELVGHPLGGPCDPRVPLVLPGSHVPADVAVEGLPGVLLAVFEDGGDLLIETVEERANIGFGLGEDLLDMGGDLGPFGLVGSFGLILMSANPGERADPVGMHGRQPGGDTARRPGAGLGQLAGLHRLDLAWGLGGMRFDVLLGVQCLGELRFVALGQLVVCDLSVRHLGVEGARAPGQVRLVGAPLGGHGLIAGHRTRRWPGLLGGHWRRRLRRYPAGVGGGGCSGFDVPGRVVLALGDHPGDLILDLGRFPRFGQLVGLVEVLR